MPLDRRSWLPAARRLSERDHVLLRLLHEHGTLTRPQIQTLLFTTPDSARGRLARLRRQGWIANFHTQRAGRPLPEHWVLGDWGSRWAAFNAGAPEPTPRQIRSRGEQLAASAQLEHLDGSNDFFVALVAASRRLNQTAPGRPSESHPRAEQLAHRPARLARWWSAARTARAMDQRVRPDGHGYWQEPSPTWSADPRHVPFYLEYDRGTEPLPRLSAKLPAYQQNVQDGFGPDWPVLIVVPTSLRERHLHEHMLERVAEREAGKSRWPGVHPYQSPEAVEAYRRDARGPEHVLTVLTTSLERLNADPLGPAGTIWRRLPNDLTLLGSRGENDVTAEGEDRIRMSDAAVRPQQDSKTQALYDPGPPDAAEDPLQGLA